MSDHGKDKITAGDIVHLNSGSPDLTVVSASDSGIEVEWLTDAGKTRRHVFPHACVMPVRTVGPQPEHGTPQHLVSQPVSESS